MKNQTLKSVASSLSGEVTIQFLKLFVFFLFALACTATHAQSQNSSAAKADVKTESPTWHPVTENNNTSAPEGKSTGKVVDGPVVNDALINIKDEQQYIERKKKEQKQVVESKEKINAPK